MKVMLTGRRMGKTTEAIKIAHKTKAYILVINEEEKRRVVQVADEMGLHIRNPVTLDEMRMSNWHTGFVENLVIDNLDEIVHRLFPRNKVQLATMTAEKYNPTSEGEK